MHTATKLSNKLRNDASHHSTDPFSSESWKRDDAVFAKELRTEVFKLLLSDRSILFQGSALMHQGSPARTLHLPLPAASRYRPNPKPISGSNLKRLFLSPPDRSEGRTVAVGI